MEIGDLYVKRNFDSSLEYANFMIKNLPYILGEKKIPKDIIYSNEFYFNPKYDIKMDPYVAKYIRIQNREIINHDNLILHNILRNKGFKVYY